MFYSKMTNNHKIWLEANTERSESNPGRSLGISMKRSEINIYSELFRPFPRKKVGKSINNS